MKVLPGHIRPRSSGMTCALVVAVALLLPAASHAAHTIRIIEGPSGTPNPVDSGGTVQCSVRAVDSEERELKYTWSCAAGVFDNPNSPAPLWVAPQNTTGRDARFIIQVAVTTEPKGLEVILGAPVARGEFTVVVRPGQVTTTGDLPDLRVDPAWILLSHDQDNTVMELEPRADQQCIMAAVLNTGPVEARDVRMRIVVSRFGREPLAIGQPVQLGNIAPGTSATASVLWDMKGRHGEQRTITVEAFAGDGMDQDPTNNRASITANIYFALGQGRAYSWQGDGYSFGNPGVEPSGLAAMVEEVVGAVAQQRSADPQVPGLMRELLWPPTYLKLLSFFDQSAAQGAGGHSIGMAASSALYFTGQRALPEGNSVAQLTLGAAHAGLDAAQVYQLPWLLTALLRRGDYLKEELTPLAALTRSRSLLRDRSRPALVQMLGDGWGHCALAYKLIEVEGRDPVLYVYDPNVPAGDQIAARRVMPQIVFAADGWHTPSFMGYETKGARYLGVHDVFDAISAQDAEGLVRPLRRLLYDLTAQSAQSGKLLVTMAGPAEMLLTSGSGKRLGIANGTLVNEFSGAEVLSQGHVQIYLVPPRERFTVAIRATGAGKMRFSVMKAESETRASVVAFSGLDIARGRDAQCVLSGTGAVEAFTLGGNPVAPTVSGTLAAGDALVWRAERNSPPSMPTVTISPQQPVVDDDLVCTATRSRDADGDQVTYKFQWYRNGALQPNATSDTVPARLTEEFDVWRCVVTPTDGKDDGPSGEATVVVRPISEEAKDWQVVRNANPPYTLNIPGNWREDTPGPDAVQLVRKRGTRNVFVEVRHNRVPEGLTAEQFQALAAGYMQRIPYLQTQTGSQTLNVPNGMVREYEYTGVLDNVAIRALVRHVLLGADYFMLIGVTETASQELNWDNVRAVLDSFSRAGGAIWGFAITAPTEGQLVGKTITITGTAQPGSRVRVSVNYWFRIIVESWALLTQREVTANEAGAWEVPDVNLDISLFGRSRQYEVVAQLLGADDTVLSTQKVRVRRE